MKLKFSWRSK